MATKVKKAEPETTLQFEIILRGADKDKKITKKQLQEVSKVLLAEVTKRLAE